MLLADSALETLDDEQRAAVTAGVGPVVIIAGAGTGKTRTIVHRIAYLVASGQVEGSKVLAVTHSTKAAGELHDRLTTMGITSVTARTFHSAALRILREFWGRTGREDELVIADNRYPIVRAVIGRIDKAEPSNEQVFDIAGEIGWAKASLIEPGAYARLATRAGRALVRPAGEIAKIYRAYEKAKDNQGLVDFEDMLVLTARLIESDAIVAEILRERFELFVVDEYQDTDPAQQLFLDAMLGGRDSLCVVGDPRQSIYTFKGADPGILGGFVKRYPHAHVVRLVRNYRSTPEIVAVANALMSTAGQEALVSHLDHGPWPSMYGARDEHDEEELVAGRIAELLAAGVSSKEIAVLYRFNAQSARFEAALGSLGISYRVADSERFFERPEIRGPLREFGRRARITPEVDGLELLRQVLSEHGYDPDNPPGGAGAARSRFDAQSALGDMLRGTLGEEAMAAQVLDEVNRRATEAHVPTTDGVTLSTLHKAKGLEYDWVFLVCMTEGSVPSMYANTVEQLDEERRLCYVGVTRARKGLVVSWSTRRPGPNGASWTSKPSRFIGDLQRGITKTSGGHKVSEVGGGLGRALGDNRLASGAGQSLELCVQCGGDLKGMAQRQLGRCGAGCLDGKNQELYRSLVVWRDAQREQTGDRVASDRALLTIVARMPSTHSELAAIAGVDKASVRTWGDDIIEVVTTYR